MTKPRFTIVTATAGAPIAATCLQSWHDLRGLEGCGGVLVGQGADKRYSIDVDSNEDDWVTSITLPNYLGPVPAFKLGMDLALQITHPDGIIACLHDDLEILEPNWDAKIMAYFNQHPEVGLLGFGGGRGLGSDDIYKSPYDPMQLARQDFVSNMIDAESHGRRVETPTPVACLDGFSQVGRVKFWRGQRGGVQHSPEFAVTAQAPLAQLERRGVIHHAYDSFLGAWAHRLGWKVTMLPISCRHYGGQTAVGDAGYAEWARSKTGNGAIDGATGDEMFWRFSHQVVYDLLRGVLPLRA